MCQTGRYQDQDSKSSCKSCPSGQEPTGDRKACVIIGEQPTVFFQRSSGECTDDGGSYIVTTKEACQDPARLLGVGVTGTFVDNAGEVLGSNLVPYPLTSDVMVFGAKEISGLYFGMISVDSSSGMNLESRYLSVEFLTEINELTNALWASAIRLDNGSSLTDFQLKTVVDDGQSGVSYDPLGKFKVTFFSIFYIFKTQTV